MYLFRIAIYAAAGLLWLAVAGARAAEYSFTYQRIIELEQPVALQLSLVRGNVSISGSEDSRLIVDAVKRIRATSEDEAEEVADHVEIKVDASQGKVAVSTNYLRMLSRSPSFWQKVLGAGSDS